MRQSKSDAKLFFDSREHAKRRVQASPALRSSASVAALPPLAQGKHYSQHRGQWGQHFELRGDEGHIDAKAFGGRVRLERRDGAPPVGEQLRRILQRNLLRIVDLFKRWDVDGSGDVDADEFCEALGALGYDLPRAEAEALFDSFDSDASGSIDYRELQAALERDR